VCHYFGRYPAKVLYYNPHKPSDFVKVPRIVPPKHKVEAVLHDIYSKLNINVGEDGSVAFRSVDILMQELLAHDPGRYQMPPLSVFLSGEAKLPIVIQWDGTGYGKQQFNTAAICNPYAPKSAQLLRVCGLGSCGDSRSGTVKVFGPNLASFNKMIDCDRTNSNYDFGPNSIVPEVLVVTDVAALRHCEHMACSGWCSCSHENALRTVPKKPETDADLDAFLLQCHSPTYEERVIWSHSILPGEDAPRPCTATGCNFAHNRATALQVRVRAAGKGEGAPARLRPHDCFHH
jgi:hypothetical protein